MVYAEVGSFQFGRREDLETKVPNDLFFRYCQQPCLVYITVVFHSGCSGFPGRTQESSESEKHE